MLNTGGDTASCTESYFQWMKYGTNTARHVFQASDRLQGQDFLCDQHLIGNV